MGFEDNRAPVAKRKWEEDQHEPNIPVPGRMKREWSGQGFMPNMPNMPNDVDHFGLGRGRGRGRGRGHGDFPNDGLRKYTLHGFPGFVPIRDQKDVPNGLTRVVSTTVWVGNVHMTGSEDMKTIEKRFTEMGLQYGQVESVRALEGMCFIKFRTRAAAEKAKVGLQSEKLDGVLLKTGWGRGGGIDKENWNTWTGESLVPRGDVLALGLQEEEVNRNEEETYNVEEMQTHMNINDFDDARASMRLRRDLLFEPRGRERKEEGRKRKGEREKESTRERDRRPHRGEREREREKDRERDHRDRDRDRERTREKEKDRSREGERSRDREKDKDKDKDKGKGKDKDKDKDKEKDKDKDKEKGKR